MGKVTQIRSVTNIVADAVSAIKDMAPGTMIPHLTMETLVDAARKGETEQVYYGRVSAVKNKLERNHGIFLECKLNMGYEFKPWKTAHEVPKAIFQQGINRAAKGFIRIQYVRLENIEQDSDRVRVIECSNAMATVNSFHRNAGLL